MLVARGYALYRRHSKVSMWSEAKTRTPESRTIHDSVRSLIYIHSMLLINPTGSHYLEAARFHSYLSMPRRLIFESSVCLGIPEQTASRRSVENREVRDTRAKPEVIGSSSDRNRLKGPLLIEREQSILGTLMGRYQKLSGIIIVSNDIRRHRLISISCISLLPCHGSVRAKPLRGPTDGR